MSFKPCTLTPEQKTAVGIARVGFMSACPFLCHYFYSEMREVPTLDLPTAATDGRTIFYNPAYLASLKPPERVFVFAHEVYHVIMKHPQRMKHYQREGAVRDTKWDQDTFNKAADYVINADLLEQGIGMMNPSWLYRSGTTGHHLVEDVYKDIYEEPPPGGGKGKGGSTFGQSGKGAKGQGNDAQADAAGGSFDQILEPSVDPVTGKEDLPDDAEFKEAIARAAGAAKAMGNMPGSFKRLVEEILEPQVDWRDHVRMIMTGRIGARAETWDRPNRRRLVLNPMVIMPGRKGYGAECVVVARDTSGSIGAKELSAFNAEIGGVLQSVRPKRVVVIDCDAKVHKVQEVCTLDEAQATLGKAHGGGGTSFVPVFDKVRELGLRPEALVYLTDMYGSFPQEAPPYPTIWCSTSKGVTAPFGDLVEIEIK